MSDGIGYPAQFRVDDDTVRRYLLDPSHEDGGAKRAFRLSVGFTLDDPVTLMTALTEPPTPQTLAYAVLQGLRNHFEGLMRGPGGTAANVRTVWRIDARPGLEPARFITLKPLRKLRAGS